MVLLTMTPSIVEGLGRLPKDALDALHSEAAPLDEPAVGKPIAHSQIVDLHRSLKSSSDAAMTISLEQLLRGSSVYNPPPPPKPEPVRPLVSRPCPAALRNHPALLTCCPPQSPEYKALMARLRREEEARSYERMLNPNPQPHVESFHERFPHASARAFAAVNQPHSATDTGDDDGITYNDIHRQVLLLINFLVSIVGVAATLWIAARWWSLPARMILTMCGSAVVAVAEVAVYSIYVWRMGDAKQRQETVKEVKEVVETWTVGKDAEGEAGGDKAVLIESKEDKEDADGVRKRNTAARTGKTD